MNMEKYYLWYHLQNQIAMREYAKKPENQSSTLDSTPKTSRQAPIDVILQRYKERNIQRFAEDEKLIQGKFETAQREEIDEDEFTFIPCICIVGCTLPCFCCTICHAS